MAARDMRASSSARTAAHVQADAVEIKNKVMTQQFTYRFFTCLFLHGLHAGSACYTVLKQNAHVLGKFQLQVSGPAPEHFQTITKVY